VTENGGTIYITEGVSVKVVDTRFQRNQAAQGGALFHAGAQLTLNGVRFDRNRASQDASHF
jgi:predicted outer membrane repeat protein